MDNQGSKFIVINIDGSVESVRIKETSPSIKRTVRTICRIIVTRHNGIEEDYHLKEEE